MFAELWGLLLRDLKQMEYFYLMLNKLFFDLIMEKRAKDFFKLLLDEGIPVNLEFKDVINEFTLLNE